MEKFIEHPFIKENTAEARIYQQVLAADVLKKGNTMIVAPTALGKTLVAVLVAADRLKKNKGSKVLILAPSKPLAIQHEENFRHFLNVKTTSITGGLLNQMKEKKDGMILKLFVQHHKQSNQIYLMEDMILKMYLFLFLMNVIML
ncbi:DEAD/DEAH box helicase [Methanobrevibacter arboriphilus]|uniref:DEAD/DEAH box helicase n=1 Tax=Methanobrevibacter arboriphilus TaxID=39441 RepID=UPI000AFD1FEC|nr:DEAD/DEAH box helicase [Methanobrevibacter arboriphilus]